MVSALFATQRRYWPENVQVMSQKKNKHNSDAASYVRSKNWVIPKTYMNGVWQVSNKYSRSFDFVNCGSTKTNIYCEYDGSNLTDTRKLCGPVREDWIRQNMNVSHPFVHNILSFVRRHDSFLDSVRAQQPSSCRTEDMFDSVALAPVKVAGRNYTMSTRSTPQT